MKDLISVIIPTYNGEKYIERAIKSIQGQTYEYVEIIIINDGSTDATLKIVEALQVKDVRISIINNEKNLGFVKSLNRGLKNSKGTYIARLDDDDVWTNPEKLEKQISFLKSNPEYVLVGGGFISIDEKNKEIKRYMPPEKDGDIRKSILVLNCIGHSTVIFLKKAVEEVGYYDERFGFFADWDLWLKLGKIGKIYNFQEYFLHYLDKELGSLYYKGRDIQRRKFLANLKLRIQYRHDYQGFYKSLLVLLASYFYSFLPYKAKLWPLTVKVRNIIFKKNI